MFAIPLALPLKSHNSVFFYMSLAPPELLSLCWSARVSACKPVSMCVGPFRGHLGFQQPSMSLDGQNSH